MTDLTATAFKVLVKPLMDFVNAKWRRLLAEQRAAISGPPLEKDLTAIVFLKTLNRLRGGQLDDNRLQQILSTAGHAIVTPYFLKKPELREWLQQEEVENGVIALARVHVMATTADDREAVRELLRASYADVIGERESYADRVIDSVVAVLTASYYAAIPLDQEPIAGMVQDVHGAVQDVSKKIDELRIDPITQQAHDEKAKSELADVLEERMLESDQARGRILHLHTQLTAGGDLASATDATKARVRYWAARLCASDKDSLDTAQVLRNLLPNQATVGDLQVVVIDALIAAGKDREDEAIQLLRDVEDADARSVLFGLLVRFRGESDALEWCTDVDPERTTEHFTHVGWRNWALAMVKTGRWKEAVRGLQAVQQNLDWEPSVAYVEGAVNAALLLPDERRAELDHAPFYRGMSASLDPHAEQHRRRAIMCFEYLASCSRGRNDHLKAAIADWHLWLRLMSPSLDESKRARDEIRLRLEGGDDVARLAPFAWAFGVTFDDRALRDYLSRRRQLGGLQQGDIMAEFLANQDTMEPRDLAHFLESHKNDIEQVSPTAATELLFGALLEDGQIDRARALITARESSLDAVVIARMKSALKDAQGDPDSRELLEETYRSSGKLQDLKLLIRHLKETNDYTASGERLQELFDRDPSVANAYELMRHWSRSPADHDKVLGFLDRHPEFAAQHEDIQTARGWALFHAGRLREAQTINESLMATRGDVDGLALDLNLAIARGDWDRLPGIVAHVWADRERLPPDMLIRLADVASQPGQSPERAVELARLAATKASEDPRILVAAYSVHLRLGCDDRADAQWLVQAEKHSTDEEGPLWSSDLKDLVEHRMPAMRERNERVEGMLLRGDAPISLAAKLLNFPLSKLFLSPSDRRDDGRGRPVRPSFWGVRAPVKIEDDWTVGFDMTSILVLGRLNLLEIAIDVLGHVKVAPDLMTALFLERMLVRFHQPARLRLAQEVKYLFDEGRVGVTADSNVPRVAVDELGGELASLLEAAKREGGMVVCMEPVHRARSYLDEIADTAAYDDVICSPVDLCAAVQRHGGLDSSAYRRAINILETQGQRKHADVGDSLLEHPVYVQSLALDYLQSAQILVEIAGLVDLHVHPTVRLEAESLLKVGGVGDDLASEIDSIVAILRAGMERNAISVLPRLDDLQGETHGYAQVRPLEGLVRAAGSCRALCVDDRWVNRRSFCVDSFGNTVPTICTLDLLEHLWERNKVDGGAYWALRHELRIAGFVFVPVEVQELRHWLEQAEVRDGQVLEGVELRTIRQTVNAVDSRTGAKQELNGLSDRIQLVTADLTRSLWMDLTVSPERAGALATWMWRHFGATAHLSARSELRQSIVRRVASRMGPLLVTDGARRRAYRAWIEAELTGPLGPANADIREEALRTLHGTVASAGEDRLVLGAFFFDCLPGTVKHDVYALDPAFAQECGMPFKRVISMGDEVTVAEADLIEAARLVLQHGESVEVENRLGAVVTVQRADVIGGLDVTWVGRDTEHRAMIPTLGLLAPDPEIRRNASDAIRSSIDPIGGAPREILDRASSRMLTRSLP